MGDIELRSKADSIIRNVGTALISDFAQGKDVVGGINGPYDDPETNIRNLVHLAIICSIELTRYGHEEYKPLIEKIGRELIAEQGSDGLYVMRKKAAKDVCNGVIGHAWLIESLVYIYKSLNDKQYIQLAVSIAEKHSFNKKIGLWERPTDGTIDFTLNHQLWYAAALSELNAYAENEEFYRQIHVFFGFLHKNFAVTGAGRIRHSAILHTNFKGSVKQILKNFLSDINEIIDRPSMAYKENGYHVFNLMALARLYKYHSSESFFSCRRFIKSIEYLTSRSFTDGLESSRSDLDVSQKNHITDLNEKSINIYGYPYNIPGFELAYIGVVFSQIYAVEKFSGIFDECLKKQIEYTYDSESMMFGTRCHDKTTINYRIYEYYRYLEIEQ